MNLYLSVYFMIFNMKYIIQYELLTLNSMEILLTFLFDWMSFMFMSFVMFISLLVIMYSSDYMIMDNNMNRFLMLVFLFVISMLMLILSPNLISILLGWDGLGLVSYCLVIYYQNVKSNNAGMITALSNRIGDVAILMAISWMMNFGSWNFIFYLDFFKNDFYMMIISYFVILAAMTKSAQIPFSAWLPAAMSAPTPVSSLVHSSTLVTAGVYLLIRFSSCLSSNILMLLMVLSSLTMFMAGLTANFEYDLKKIIAFSTLSQLGLMMSILCSGEMILAFFHLLMHALFKATLFMSAGIMIHMFMNYQDIRFMGGLSFQMPIMSMIFIISNLSLCGFPFLSGFYSKDLLLEVVSMNYLNFYIYLMYFISTGLTVSYTFRLLNYLFFKNFNFLSLSNINENSKNLFNSVIIILISVIFSGSIFNWLVFEIPYLICLPLYMKLMPIFLSLMGVISGFLISYVKLNYIKNNNYFKIFFGSMWNLPMISSFVMMIDIMFLSKLYYYKIDQGWMEFYGSQNLNKKFIMSSIVMQIFLKNNFKLYMLITVIWLIFMFLFINYLNSLISA
uniref:NADH-ubiquinone oxidoreductase chain 5 n=1 Tax=Stenus comma TaxID=513399 RepID=A0A0S2M8X8_9COLE|nr:NADH deshydrogenase subunit 5 [Stenus comma]